MQWRAVLEKWRDRCRASSFAGLPAQAVALTYSITALPVLGYFAQLAASPDEAAELERREVWRWWWFCARASRALCDDGGESNLLVVARRVRGDAAVSMLRTAIHWWTTSHWLHKDTHPGCIFLCGSRERDTLSPPLAVRPIAVGDRGCTVRFKPRPRVIRDLTRH